MRLNDFMSKKYPECPIYGEEIEDTPTFGTDLSSDNILGLAKLEDGIKILLEADKVLATEELALIKDIK